MVRGEMPRLDRTGSFETRAVHLASERHRHPRWRGRELGYSYTFHTNRKTASGRESKSRYNLVSMRLSG
jgi:hypothetical protein